MGSNSRWMIPLREAADCEETLIGGKARQLAMLARAGFRTPDGFCITTSAYRAFVEQNKLSEAIFMELGRKPLDEMRWEELWDAALRIRSAFLCAPLPPSLEGAVTDELSARAADRSWAVRSSAPGEDSQQRSFAGLHESRVDLIGHEAVCDAIRVVWASLWSDAALLYRRELDLDPSQSLMAVVVQEMIVADRSGVAFARDPRRPTQESAVVEAVPGACRDLVDGMVDPDRWLLSRPDGEVLEWRPGERDQSSPAPLLEAADLSALMTLLLDVEALFGWPPDIEWIGRGAQLALLQARPISTLGAREADEPRQWYLSLRPGAKRLARLCDRVEAELIPQLAAEGENLAAASLDSRDDAALSRAIEDRLDALKRWRRTYREEFIPLAHGVRQLGIYYGDAVRPRDPYEFVGLLRAERTAASIRNERLLELAARIREDPALARELRAAVADSDEPSEILQRLEGLSGGRSIRVTLDQLLSDAMDVSYDNQRLSSRVDLLLQTIVALAERTPGDRLREDVDSEVRTLEQRLFAAVGRERHDEAKEVLRIARVSWRLRDDDNLLLGRIESQLLRALEVGADRLRAAGRLERIPALEPELAVQIAQALRDPSRQKLVLPESQPVGAVSARDERWGDVRQLVGQPAGPGLGSGPIRQVRGVEDLGRFRGGEVLVCDAIQPTMTHLVPLACAIIERRGGMLIHGSIIARELGIPCVNGVSDAVQLLPEGQWAIVDGDLGIVTVGRPELDLERA